MQAFARSPRPDERATALALLGNKPTAENIADLLGALVMLPEFQLIR
jgi:hypothetical protein